MTVLVLLIYNTVWRLVKSGFRVVVWILLLPLRVIGWILFRPHYRRGKARYNRRHPFYVMSKDGRQYRGVSLTHDDKQDNIKFEKNPNQMIKRTLILDLICIKQRKKIWKEKSLDITNLVK